MGREAWGMIGGALPCDLSMPEDKSEPPPADPAALGAAMGAAHGGAFDAGWTISGQPQPAWPAAEYDPRKLAARVHPARPQGAFEPWAGDRLDLAAQADPDGLDGLATGVVRRIAAYPVLPLIGATFEIGAVTDIASAVPALLQERLPGLDWWVPVDWSGPFLKYGFVHASLPAPPDELSGDARAIEVFGRAARTLFGSPAWLDQTTAWMLKGSPGGERPAVVEFPTRVVIEVATLSNVAFPGWQVPLYA